MAQNVAALYEKELRYPDGTPVQCVIADQAIGGVHEANLCAKKFETNNVGVSLSVTPCWAYGSETMDMNPTIPKAIWGFNGTERPGAVYLAATLAAHNQFGLPAFGIYGRDVQDLGDEIIPEDVKEKLINFAKAGLAVAIMRVNLTWPLVRYLWVLQAPLFYLICFVNTWECAMSMSILQKFTGE